MKQRKKTMASEKADQQSRPLHKARIPLSHRTSAKTVAFVLVVLMAAVIAVSVIGSMVMIQMEVYTSPIEDIRRDFFGQLSRSVANQTLDSVIYGDQEELLRSLNRENIAGIEINASGEHEFHWSYGEPEKKDGVLKFEFTYQWNGENVIWNYFQIDETMDDLVVAVYVPEVPVQHDTFFTAAQAAEWMYALRYWVYAVAAAALIVWIFGFVFLMSGAGHHGDSEEVRPGWGTGVPIDILLCGYILLMALAVQMVAEAMWLSDMFPAVFMLFVVAVAGSVVTVGVCMSVAVRLKRGKWWKNSVIYFFLHIGRVCLKKIGAMLRHLCALMSKIPLVWKTALGYVCIAVIELFIFLMFYWDADALMVIWMLCKILLFPAVIYLAYVLYKLKKGGEAIAKGDLSYQVDTRYMYADFRQHGENLNQIGSGMTHAVEQRLKSERMKTELITNVSHDIKTPLTSIINYSDLIEKEPNDNPKITEYAAVLHRQSDRLKRLIEDLVEASKASTGNLEVHLAPCELGVIIGQTVAEYEQRLDAGRLQIITRQPEESIRIMADGRRLWRVFDNLLNNICKYGQPGTRVYLTLERVGADAVISFKNTSRDELNLSAEELMERFVRGDSARNSEGNGLGLSIAKSLTELQNGRMDVSVDGDLFKVVLRFPTI